MAKNIFDVANSLGLSEDEFEPYGKDKGKIVYKKEFKKRGKLILVTAITPTKAGEGKTTCSIALADGLAGLNKKVCLALREPSLGPVFGIKGGATGGGKVSIVPSEDINLHFTGDMHALTSANNLICAIIDNHIYQGNELNIDPNRVVFKRCMDMNDRALRVITVAQGKNNGVVREDGFNITVATELMAVLCLCNDKKDFINRLNAITVAYNFDGEPITVKDLHITNAVMKLMKDALKPNLVQTLYGTPAIVHGGPFANIAHGCNSIIATKTALSLADYVVTEAGFGSDLGAEKFLDIKCRVGDLNPNAIVVVATIRALKNHGGAEDLVKEDIEALKRGFNNLKVHVENMKNFNKDVVIAINHFESDTSREIETLKTWCKENSYPFAFTDGFIKGQEGCIELANKVLEVLENSKETQLNFTYNMNDSIKTKIEKIAKNIYRAGSVEYSELAEEQIKEYEKRGYNDFYVCIAKTPQSLSDNAKLMNVPENHTLHVKRINLSTGARFLVPITGSILTMPGLPKVPAAVKMEEESDGD